MTWWYIWEVPCKLEFECDNELDVIAHCAASCREFTLFRSGLPRGMVFKLTDLFHFGIFLCLQSHEAISTTADKKQQNSEWAWNVWWLLFFVCFFLSFTKNGKLLWILLKCFRNRRKRFMKPPRSIRVWNVMKCHLKIKNELADVQQAEKDRNLEKKKTNRRNLSRYQWTSEEISEVTVIDFIPATVKPRIENGTCFPRIPGSSYTEDF